MQHCFNADLYCAIASVASCRARMSSQYPSLVNSLSYGSNKQVCASSESDELKQKKGNNFSHTEKILLYCPERGEITLSSDDFRAFTFRLFFVIFP